jgi:uncharacterized paraquat-inducible protein A
MQEARMVTGVLALFAAGKWPLASLILLTVVVLTIFAAKSFDPRLVWDAMGEEE